MTTLRLFSLLLPATLLLLALQLPLLPVVSGSPSDAATARRLVSSNTWGVVSTSSRHLNGTAWGNLLSYSDGPPGAGSGTPYFYLSGLDATLQDLAADARCSLTVSQLGTAAGCATDPEDPTCAKLTLSGRMRPVPDDRLPHARAALFTRHPQMASWPAGHHFEFHYLEITDLFLLDHYGGAVPLTVEEYYAAAGEVAQA